MSVATKSRPAPAPSPAPVLPATIPAEAAEVPPLPKPVYRGDSYGIMLWLVGAIILVVLHIVDALYWWVQR